MMKDWIALIFMGLVIAGPLVSAALAPYFEAKSFNECTGGNASYMTALTTELRVENCNRESKL